MNNKHLTNGQKEEIKNYYLAGHSYRDIHKKYGYANATISRVVKGLRSHKDGIRLARKQGKYKITEEGRKKLSEAGKRSTKNSSKMWTKPEREFKKILNNIGYGVKFTEDVKSIFSVDDDKSNVVVYFQYPIQRYICDYVIPSQKIIFRIMGDYWHANPNLYNRDNKDSLTKPQRFNIVRDVNKKIFLEKHGWTVLDIWESDIYWRKEYVIKAIGAVGSMFDLHSKGPQFEPGIAYSDEEWSDKLKKIWFKKPKIKKVVQKQCPTCDVLFKVQKVGTKKEQKYCSGKCYNLKRRKVADRPSEEQLMQEVADTNYCEVGRKYGVSDNCIRKWLK
ncbi:helix-turn-helix domain-containing protein [Candidatus Pacearchaeota archaeon]|nr:helix-turn-helix domain-containing protein [Candidatus Pacearchaeota archaeon]